MKITGSDYTYWTNMPGEATAAKFLEKVRLMWPTALVDDERHAGDVEIFISKDAAMDDFQDKNGYALNEDGEGCFMFFACSKSFFHGDVHISNILGSADLMSTDPHNSTIFLANPTRYTLVLPTLLEESEFSKKIHTFLIDSLSESAMIK
ncbi:hypothetical protein [Massilia sp. CCM 8734]|uniref:hypothetical protein n=1 Tax=Massilia sp. CCM 8734 TaxID=2609283 RepID=UPI0014226339|nr:hypothetical protein [Massilia sp. CCM 8734]NIA00672.1 hypothetical protein [Massilia sp. CCM 8734]